MATYVLIHGAGSDATYWYLVTPKLEEAGHRVITMDLPSDDDDAQLSDYVDVVVTAVDHAAQDDELVVVAQSIAGFIAPVVCTRVDVDLLVMVAAMVPAPGETAGAWWDNTGQGEAMRANADRIGLDLSGDFDPVAMFLHDVPADVVANTNARPQSGTIFEQPWPLEKWPDVPTRFLLCRDDRFFPADFQRRVVEERLGIVPDEIDGGHCPALGHPDELVAKLETYRTDLS